jgi:RNA 2',3'-cyclic 3'-phosphodiesterase
MSRGATARLFAAVDPPPAAREQLVSWAREASAALRGRGSGGSGVPGAAAGGPGPAEGASLRLLAPETMHVTLCFLGGRPVGEMQALAAALERCELPGAAELSLGAPLWLPPRNPRSLALAVGDDEGWLQRLQRTVSDAFARAIAWEPERRRFRAHVTVARVARAKPSRPGGRPRRDRRARASGRGEREPPAPGPLLPPTPQLSFTPCAVVLYRSWLDPQGASYEAVATRALVSQPSGGKANRRSVRGDL